MARTLEVVILGKDKLSGTMRGIGGSLANVGKMAAIGMAGAGVAVAGLGAALGKLAYDAAQLEPVRITFDNLSASIGTTSESLLRELRPAVMGTLSDAQLMQAANKLMAMGLADSEEKAAELAKMATTLGTAMGVDATTALEDFTLMLANQSIPRLDTFGISSGKVRERINELQAETEGLTREQAFLQATMELGAEAMERVGDVSDTTAVKLAAGRAAFTNLKDTIGAAVLPVFASLVERYLTPLVEKVAEVTAVLGEWLPQAFAEVGRAISGAETDFEALSGILATVFGPEMAGAILDVFQGTIIPVLRDLISFIQDQLVPAVRDQVLPAIQEWVGWFVSQLVPVITDLVIPAIRQIASVVLPLLQAAIQFVMDHWEAFKKIAIAVGLVILALKAPILVIVGAIGVLAMAWANNWGGIRDKIQTIWAAIQPVLKGIADVISYIFTNVLPPLRETFQEVWQFIQELIAAAWEGIRPHLDELQAVLAQFWLEIQPRLEDAWSQIQEAMMTVAEWWAETFIPKVRELWDRLEPVRELVIELTKAFASFMASSFIEGLKMWLSAIIGLWDAVAGAIQGVINIIGTIVGVIDTLLSALARLPASIPSWLLPSSPSPLETSLRGIADAMRDLSAVQTPALAAVGAMAPAGVPAPPPEGVTIVNYGTIHLSEEGVDVRAVLEGLEV